MTKVGVARLKAGLSGYLKKVRQGAEVEVYDRNTPVARLVPVERTIRAGRLVVTHPAPGAPRIQDVLMPPPLPGGDRLVSMLIEERQRDRDGLR